MKDMALLAAGTAMWNLAVRHTGHVGYRGGTKAQGLRADPPVIDCSGWVALLLAEGMRAANTAVGEDAFVKEDIEAVDTWSDRIIQLLEHRSGMVLEGDRITLENASLYTTIGLQQGGGAWASNHPRARGITHIVQVVHRPGYPAPYVSEAQGWAEPFGLRLLPLAEWLDVTRPFLKPGSAWAVDAFRRIRSPKRP